MEPPLFPCDTARNGERDSGKAVSDGVTLFYGRGIAGKFLVFHHLTSRVHGDVAVDRSSPDPDTGCGHIQSTCLN